MPHRKRDFLYPEFMSVHLNYKKDLLFYIYGQENYLKEKVLQTLIKAMHIKVNDEFDFLTLYGDECQAETILEQVEMMPFLAEKRVLVVRDFEKIKADERKKLIPYLNDPAETSVLIILDDKPDKKYAVYKTILEKSISVQCKQPYSPVDLRVWLNDELKMRGLIFEGRATDLFINSIPLDYFTAFNELDKLALYIGTRKNITYEDVLSCVCKNKVYTIFELQNAIGKKDVTISLSILDNLLENDEAAVMMTTMLARFFTLIWKVNACRKNKIGDSEIMSYHLNEVHNFFRKDYMLFANKYPQPKLRKVFALLLKADADLKSLNVKENILMEMLVYNICKI